MTKTYSPVFLCLILVMLYATFCNAAHEFLPGLEQDLNEDIANYITRHHQYREVAHLTEELFGLPRNHLSPFQAYAPEHENLVQGHIRTPSSTYASLKVEDGTHTIFAAPYRYRRLLYLIVQHSDGLVVPVGFSRVPSTPLPGHGGGLWQTFRAAASITQQEMVTRFPNLHL